MSKACGLLPVDCEKGKRCVHVRVNKTVMLTLLALSPLVSRFLVENSDWISHCENAKILSMHDVVYNKTKLTCFLV